MGQTALQGEASWNCCSQRAAANLLRFQDDWTEVESQRVVEEATASSGFRLLPTASLAAPHCHHQIENCYSLGKQIGFGSSSDVFEATPVQEMSLSASSASEAAIKLYLVRGEKSAQEYSRNFAELDMSFERECLLLSELRHPHIARLLESFSTKDRKRWLALELCSGGELHGHLTSRIQQGLMGLEEQHTQHFFRQMLHVVNYLHALWVIHRDIKSENFLLLGKPGTWGGSFLKLCDFGSAVQLLSVKGRSPGRVGTLSYTAPEVYLHRGASMASDYWSLGVVLYVMLTALSPFRELEPEPREAVVQRIREGNMIKARKAWHSLSDGARDLVEALVKVPEDERLRPVDALAHHWMFQGPQLSRQPRHERGSEDGKAYAVLIVQLLERFSNLDRLQKLALAVCAQAASESLMQHVEATIPWYDLFLSFDMDKDGKLSFHELQLGLLSLNDGLPSEAPDEDHWTAALRHLDLNGDGFIDWGEWSALAMMSDKDLPERTGLLHAAFRILDRPSGDDRIAADDLLPLAASQKGLTFMATEVAMKVDELLRLWSPHSRDPPHLHYDDFRRLLWCAVELPTALQNLQKVVESEKASSFIAEEHHRI